MVDTFKVNPHKDEIERLTRERDAAARKAERDLVEARNRVRTLNAMNEYINNTREFVGEARVARLPDEIRMAINNASTSYLEGAKNRTDELAKLIRQYEKSAARAFDRVAELHITIPRLQRQEFEWTPDAVKEALSTHQNVVANSIRFSNEGGKTWVYVRLTNLYFEVQDWQNEYTNINDGGKVEVPLGDIMARIEPVSGSIHFIPVRGQGPRWPYGFNANEMVHPHVLSREYVCVGTFGEQMKIAARQMRWLEVIDICLAFLGKVNLVNDEAGRHWMKWLFHSPAFPEKQIKKWDTDRDIRPWVRQQRDAGVEFWCTKEHGPMLKQEWENLKAEQEREMERVAAEVAQEVRAGVQAAIDGAAGEVETPAPPFELVQETDGPLRQDAIIDADQPEGVTMADLLRAQIPARAADETE